MLNCCKVELKFYKKVRIIMVQNMKLKQTHIFPTPNEKT